MCLHFVSLCKEVLHVILTTPWCLFTFVKTVGPKIVWRHYYQLIHEELNILPGPQRGSEHVSLISRQHLQFCVFFLFVIFVGVQLHCRMFVMYSCDENVCASQKLSEHVPTAGQCSPCSWQPQGLWRHHVCLRPCGNKVCVYFPKNLL